MGYKAPDWQGAYCCSDCHAWLDGGFAQGSSRDIRDLMHLEGVMRTQARLIEKGLIEIKGAA